MSLLTDPIPLSIRRIAVPICIGFFFQTMFNVTDTYFAGYYSTAALAGVSISFPVVFILFSLSSGLSTGGTTLMAQALGKNDKEAAQELMAQLFTFIILISIPVALTMIVSARDIVSSIGATGEYLEHATTYIQVLFLGTPFFMLVSGCNSALMAQGESKVYGRVLIASFFINIILDPILIFGFWIIPPLGVAGLALATVSVQVLGAAYLGIHANRSGVLTFARLSLFLPRPRVLGELLYQGVPAALNFMTIALGFFIVNSYVASYGENAVAGYGAALRIEQIILLPSIGINMAVLSLVGQHAGAELYGRIQEIISVAYRYMLLCMILGTGIMLIAPSVLMQLFSDHPDVIAAGTNYLQVAALITIAYGTIHLLVGSLQGMKHPQYAFWLGLSRQGIFPWLFFPLFTQFFGLAGIWWGIFTSAWLAAIFTFFYHKRILSKKQTG